MNKKTFSEKIIGILGKMKIPTTRANFKAKVFVNPKSETDGELTLTGAQIAIVLASKFSDDIKYKFYQVNEDILKNGGREKIIKSLKSQYPGIIFYICNESKTIDTKNNLIIIDNDDFDIAVDLLGGASEYLKQY